MRAFAKNIKRIFFSTIICFLMMPAESQDSTDLANATVLKRIVVDGDTLYVTSLEEVYIFPEPTFDSWWAERRYRRLVHNLKTVYPYAVMAGDMLKELNEELKQIESERKRKELIKEKEDELLSRYEDELKKLTITQGRLLIKLIDRQTGNTSYDLVKELRGSFSAFFWQALARLFGSNLKSEYDPDGEDRLIEQIVVRIEKGVI